MRVRVRARVRVRVRVRASRVDARLELRVHVGGADELGHVLGCEDELAALPLVPRVEAHLVRGWGEGWGEGEGED